MRGPSIFLSYSHRDERKKDLFVTQLGVKYAADLWNDDRIRPGEDWKHEIDRAMARAKVAVLLVTANFLTSNFILDVEVPKLLKQHREDGLDIFPVIAEECAWDLVPWLAEMNVRPKNGRPVWDGSRYVNRKLADIVREIDAILVNTPAREGRSRPVLPTVRGSRHRTGVAEALDEIDEALGDAGGSGRMGDIAEVERVIVIAVSHGAPLYNRGDIMGCAEIYLQTVMRLNNLLGAAAGLKTPRMRGMGPPLPLMPVDDAAKAEGDAMAVAREELLRVSALKLTAANADKVAWEIRHAFDHVRFISHVLKAVEAAFARLRDSHARYHQALPEAITTALAQGALIYKEGRTRGKNWIKGCAVVYLHAAREMLSFLESGEVGNDETSAASIGVAQAELKTAVRRSGALLKENAYQMAWDIRYALERIVGAVV
jgi:TIR domain